MITKLTFPKPALWDCACACVVYFHSLSHCGRPQREEPGRYHWEIIKVTGCVKKNQAAMAGAGRLVRQRRHVALSAAAVKAIWQIKVLVEKQGTTAQGAD